MWLVYSHYVVFKYFLIGIFPRKTFKQFKINQPEFRHIKHKSSLYRLNSILPVPVLDCPDDDLGRRPSRPMNPDTRY